MKKQVIVLDTNVLLDDPNALYSFPEAQILLPIVCIEEVDRFKKDMNGIGRNAREVSRHLDRLRKDSSLSKGVHLDNGAELRIVMGSRFFQMLSSDLSQSNDNYILAVAMEAAASDRSREVTLVSKDTNMRLKADAMGIRATDYQPDSRVQIEELYTGLKHLTASRAAIDRLYTDGRMDPPEDTFYPNEYFCLTDETDPQHVGLAKFSLEDHCLKPVKVPPQVWSIGARNLEQRVALDLLLNESVRLVTLVGKAGTGKTLLALAAGLMQTADKRMYTRMLVSRPVFPMGRDIGFLPGELQDKLKPWMQPIFDNLEFIISGEEAGRDPKLKQTKHSGGSYQELMSQGMVVVEPLTYIRGRSIPNQYFIVDEAQNLTPHEIKTIISRAGHGTKIILTGDPYQIDNPYLDGSSNGLAYVTERMKGCQLAGHITLEKGERSSLAQAAADLL